MSFGLYNKIRKFRTSIFLIQREAFTMLIMLVENNIDELRNLQRYVSECYTDSDIVPFSDSSDAMQFIQSDRFSVDLCFTAVVM